MTIVDKLNYVRLRQFSSTGWVPNELASSDPSQWFQFDESERQPYTCASVRVISKREIPSLRAKEFVQGGNIYRNEKAVHHAHVESTFLPRLSGRIPAFDGMRYGNVFNNGHNTQFTVWREFAIADAMEISPGDCGSIFVSLSASWYDGKPFSSSPSVSAFGKVWSQREQRWINLKVAVSGYSTKPANPMELLTSSSRISVTATINDTGGVDSGYNATAKVSEDLAIILRQSEYSHLRAVTLPTSQVGVWKDESSWLTPERYYARGKIVGKIAESVGRMTDNNAQLIVEVLNIIKDIVEAVHDPSQLLELFRSIRQVRTAKQAAKLAASLRLSEQYGVKLTVRDLLNVSRFLRRDARSIARAGCTYQIPTTEGIILMDEHWKVFYDPNPSKQGVIAHLLRSDLIGLQNLWDFVPYSFVVDWFAPVGDILQGWDDELMLSKLPIHAIVVGSKASGKFVTNVPEGQLRSVATSYDRTLASSFPPYATATCHSVSTTTVVNGAALIVQRL